MKRQVDQTNLILLCLERLEPLYRYVFYQVKDQKTAEELVAEIMLEAGRKASSRPRIKDFSVWLYRIACAYLYEDPRFVSTLPFLEKQVVILKFVLGLTNREISQVLVESTRNIKLLQCRALSLLSRNIEGGLPKIDKRLADTLDTCFERITAGESPVRCLFKYDRQRTELEPLLRVGLAIAAGQKVSPDETFKSELKASLPLESGPDGEKTGSPAPGPPQRAASRPAAAPVSETNQSSLPAGILARLNPANIRNTLFRSKLGMVTAAASSLIVVALILLSTGILGNITSGGPRSAICTLTPIAGSVEIQRTGVQTWEKVKADTDVRAGDKVKTGGASAATLAFADGSEVTLEATTELSVKEAKVIPQKTSVVSLEQSSGRTAANVKKLLPPDSRFELQTPVATISVQGTRFTTEVAKDDVTTVKADEGTVKVSAQGKDILLNAGYQVKIEPGKAPGAPTSTRAEPSPTPTPSPTFKPSPTPTPTLSPSSTPPRSASPVIPTFGLTVKANKGGAILQPAQASTPVTANKTVDLIAVSDTGYAFTGWTGDIANVADAKSATTNVTMRGNTSLTANFASVYTLTIRTKGGSILKPREGTVYTSGSFVDLAAKPDDGYRFVNWTGDISTIPSSTSANTTIIITANTTITANFARVYKLNVKSMPGGWVLKPGEGTFSYNDGTLVDLQAVADKGYLFSGWMCEGNTLADSTTASTRIMMDRDSTVAPVFTKTDRLYTLTSKAGAGGKVTQPGQGVFTSKEGTTVNLAASPDPGYAFFNWTGDTASVGNIYSANTTVTMKTNYTLTANFVKTYTLTVGTSFGGTVTQPGGVTYVYNADTVVPLVAVPSAGYVFVNWTGETASVADPSKATTSIKMSVNANITANFAKMYELKIAASGGGTVSQPGVGTFSYREGSVVSLVAVANPGCTFVSWNGSTSAVSEIKAVTTNVTISGNYAITANFISLDQLPALTLNHTGEGSVTQPGEGRFSYMSGTQVRLSASPATGYAFAGWSGNTTAIADSASANTTITVTGNAGLTANFARLYTVSINATAGGIVVQPGRGDFQFKEGGTVELAALPSAGYRFAGWTGDVDLIADPAAIRTTLTVSRSVTITANFAPAG